VIERWWLRAVLYTLGLLRWAVAHDARAYALLTLPLWQPFLDALGRLRAREVFLKARDECPAYGRFLGEQGYRGSRRWCDVPVTTKENYVKRFAIEARCYCGRLAGRGQLAAWRPSGLEKGPPWT